MTAAFKRADLDSAMQQVVLLCLANHANETEGRSWPKLATIAEECRTTTKTIRVVLQELQQKGIIKEDGIGSNGSTAWLVPDNETVVYGTPTFVKKESQRGKAPKAKKTEDRGAIPLFKGKDFLTDEEVTSLPGGKRLPAHREKTSHQPEVTSLEREKTSLATLSNQEATKKQPDSFATATASPIPIEAVKETIRHDWVASIRQQFDALPASTHIDANKEVRLAVEKFGRDGYDCWCALVAGNHGDYIAPKLVSLNIGGWKVAGKPASYALWGRKNGATNGTYNGIHQAGPSGTGRDKYDLDEEVEAAFRESSRSQQRQVPA